LIKKQVALNERSYLRPGYSKSTFEERQYLLFTSGRQLFADRKKGSSMGFTYQYHF